MDGDAVRVIVRVRPVSGSVSWRVHPPKTITSDSDLNYLTVEVDDVVDAGTNTKALYNRAVATLARDVTKGINATVFAYGQTSSGKTYTMRGVVDVNNGDRILEPGIMNLAVQDVFEAVAADVRREYLIRCSYMEIYNEEIKDLLNPRSGERLQVHEAVDRGVYVAGLSEEVVSSASHVMEILNRGERERHVGSTNMNARSSRSHALFRMVVESRELDDVDAVKVSTLMLVDLAGSERLNKTGAAGARAREGAFINKSLLTLSNVITKLSELAQMDEGQAQHVHVPYRESKLTRILQPSLGGNARTAVICAVNPSREHHDETVGTLRFATRCGNVRNAAVVNEVVNEAALLCRQKREIESLRQQLEARGGAELSNLDDEVRALRNALLEKEQANDRIWLQLEEEKATKEAQRRQIDSLTTLVMSARPGAGGDRGDADAAPQPRSFKRRGSRRETWCPGVDGTAMDLRPIREASPALVAVRSGSIDVATPQSSERGAVAATRATETANAAEALVETENGTSSADSRTHVVADARNAASGATPIASSASQVNDSAGDGTDDSDAREQRTVVADPSECESANRVDDGRPIVLHIRVDDAPPPATSTPPPVIVLAINVVDGDAPSDEQRKTLGAEDAATDESNSPTTLRPSTSPLRLRDRSASEPVQLTLNVIEEVTVVHTPPPPPPPPVAPPVHLTLKVVEDVTIVEPPRVELHVHVVDAGVREEASEPTAPPVLLPTLDLVTEELERARSRVEDLEAEKAEMARASDAASSKLADSESEASMLRTRLAEAASASTARADAHASEVAQLREELKSRNRQLHKMMEVYSKLKKKHVRGGGNGEDLDRVRDAKSLEFELDYANTKRRQMREQVDALSKDKGKLEDENRVLREQAANNCTARQREC